MPVTGPDFVSLQVRDLAASQAFYERYLGLQRSPAGPPHAVVFTTQPIAFALRDVDLLLARLDETNRRGTEGLEAMLALAALVLLSPVCSCSRPSSRPTTAGPCSSPRNASAWTGRPSGC